MLSEEQFLVLIDQLVCNIIKKLEILIVNEILKNCKSINAAIIS
jgi:hypothetical protein